MERDIFKGEEIGHKVDENGLSKIASKVSGRISGGFALMAIVKKYQEGYPIKIHSLGIEVKKIEDLKEEGKPT